MTSTTLPTHLFSFSASSFSDDTQYEAGFFFFSSSFFCSTRNKVPQVPRHKLRRALAHLRPRKRFHSASEQKMLSPLRKATWKFDRKLRVWLAALCSCWRDEIIQAASPLSALESREKASRRKQTFPWQQCSPATCSGGNGEEGKRRALTLSLKKKSVEKESFIFILCYH